MLLGCCCFNQYYVPLLRIKFRVEKLSSNYTRSGWGKGLDQNAVLAVLPFVMALTLITHKDSKDSQIRTFKMQAPP